MVAYSASCLSGLFKNSAVLNKGALAAGNTMAFAHDVISLQKNYENRCMAYKENLEGAPEALQKVFKGIKTYSFLATAKDVVSCVSGFFGLLLMMTGVAVIPGIACATLSFASVGLAVARKLYADTLETKQFYLLDNKSVQVLV